jgi:dipeptidyl aminopeptidase/acylaminoacyl peptidase
MQIFRTIAKAICLAALVANGPAAAADYSISDILSAPFADGLVAAEKAERIAWVSNLKGVRNIWTAAAPDFAPRQLTAYADDDGQALGALALSPDGSGLLYVRGSAPNLQGQIANPTSDPAGAKRQVWYVATSGGEVLLVGEGASPGFMPNGEILYRTAAGLVTRPVESGQSGAESEAEPTPLFSARGGISNWSWSPDGSALAFVSNRGAHSFVGVYRQAEQSITWMAPGIDRDVNPVWSPDSRRLAYIRLPGFKGDEWNYFMMSGPFELWVADAKSGEGRAIFQADNGNGVYPLYAGLPLYWADDNILAFQSEHEGWMRLYRIGREGGAATALMEGNCEVETAWAAPDRSIVVSDNCDDIDRRDLWRIDVLAGDRQRLTRSDAIEASPVAMAGHIAYRAADVMTPMGIYVANADGSAARKIYPQNLPDDFPLGKLVTPQPVKLVAEDGFTSYGQVFAAEGGQRKPAVIFMHGGPIRQMLLGWHMRGYYANAYALNQYLAANGYVVLALNYRAGIGYGRDFRVAANQGPRGSSEYGDVVAAGRYLQSRRDVNPARVGLWGGSYGGTLTGMGLSRNPELFRTGVAYHGVFDWSMRSFKLRGKEGRGGWSIIGDEAHALAHASSTVGDLNRWKAPVLLISGDDDRNVVFAQTIDLARRLRERGVHVETLVFPDEVHGFLRHENWVRAYEATAEFLDRYLKGGD